MFRVFNCLTVEHDWRLVLLAAVICFLTSLAAINLFHRARAASGRAQLVWLATAGVTTGCGIWATHFIAMLAYEPGIPVGYNVGLTILSLMVAAAVTNIGFAVALAIPGLWAAVVGGVVVAPTASELILPIALAVQNQLTVEHLALTFSVYPSLSGSITEAGRQLMRHDDLD